MLSGGRSQISLDAEGERQISRLAEQLADKGIARIETSPRPRTRRTADIIARRLGVEVEVADALDEIDFGEWTGKSYSALDADPRWHRWNDMRAAAATPGGEDMNAVAERIGRHLEELARTDGAPVLCVSHGDVIKAGIARYLGLSLDHLLRFDVDPASVSVIEAGPWGGRLTLLNGGAP